MNKDEIIDAVEKMTVMELNELVKAIEEKWGVSATAVAVAGPAASGEAAEEKSTFTIKLVDKGSAPIGIIKAIREPLGLGLAEAKKLVDETPSVLKENMKKEDAQALKAAIEAAGGKVELS